MGVLGGALRGAGLGFLAGGGRGIGGGLAMGAAPPPENASYEELLAWEEARGGGVSTGMSRAQLSSLPRRPFLGSRDALKGEEAVCAICQMEYDEGDEVGNLVRMEVDRRKETSRRMTDGKRMTGGKLSSEKTMLDGC